MARRRSIELLPEAADGAIAMAIDRAVVSCRQTKLDAWKELNRRLRELGCREVSLSAFHRFLQDLDGREIPERWQKNPAVAAERNDIDRITAKVLQELTPVVHKIIDSRLARVSGHRAHNPELFRR